MGYSNDFVLWRKPDVLKAFPDFETKYLGSFFIMETEIEGVDFYYGIYSQRSNASWSEIYNTEDAEMCEVASWL